MHLKNVSSSVVGLPDGPLAPGQIAEADESTIKNRIIAGWIEAGILQAVPSGNLVEATMISQSRPRFVEGAASTDEKDEIIARLAEHGVTRDRRSSVQSLRSLLAEHSEKGGD